MKKSSQVSVSLIAVLAAGLTAGGCSNRSSMGDCVDARGYSLPDSDCMSGGGMGGAHWIHTGGFGGSGYSGGFFGG